MHLLTVLLIGAYWSVCYVDARPLLFPKGSDVSSNDTLELPPTLSRLSSDSTPTGHNVFSDGIDEETHKELLREKRIILGKNGTWNQWQFVILVRNAGNHKIPGCTATLIEEPRTKRTGKTSSAVTAAHCMVYENVPVDITGEHPYVAKNFWHLFLRYNDEGKEMQVTIKSISCYKGYRSQTVKEYGFVPTSYDLCYIRLNEDIDVGLVSHNCHESTKYCAVQLGITDPKKPGEFRKLAEYPCYSAGAGAAQYHQTSEGELIPGYKYSNFLSVIRGDLHVVGSDSLRKILHPHWICDLVPEMGEHQVVSGMRKADGKAKKLYSTWGGGDSGSPILCDVPDPDSKDHPVKRKLIAIHMAMMTRGNSLARLVTRDSRVYCGYSTLITPTAWIFLQKQMTDRQ